MKDDDGIYFSGMNDPNDWSVPKATVIAEIPRDLGCVTSIQVRRGRIVCETESGIEFVVGIPAELLDGHDGKSKI